MSFKNDRQRIYNIYAGIKHRCFNKKSYAYHRYGGRGIKICEEWLNDFTSFYNWALENGYASNLTIDRINNDGNYEPNNCRWVTNQEQRYNTCRSRFITINGKTLTIAQWAKESGLDRKVIERRLQKGITGVKLLEETFHRNKNKIIQKDLQGNFLKEWKSLQEIENNTPYVKTPIANVCKKKKYYHTAYGYIWEYKKED